MKKRVVALLLAGVLGAVCVAGCGSSKETAVESTETQEAAPVEETAEQEAEETDAETEEEAEDTDVDQQAADQVAALTQP